MKIVNPNQRKTCPKCEDEQNIEQFELRKDTQKRRNNCISCNKKSAKERYHKLHPRTRRVGPAQNRSDYNKEYYAQNSNSVKEQQAEYRVNNKVSIRKYNNEWEKDKRRNDPFFRLRKDLSRVINVALKENSGSKHNFSVMNYLPYTIEELKKHLESQFESWMTWDNQGVYQRSQYREDNLSTWTWHIDHIIPQSKLLYASMADDNFKKCWSLNNLRPLKSLDNMKKSNK